MSAAETFQSGGSCVQFKLDLPVCLSVGFRAAVACLGALFEHVGRMLATSFKDTLANLLKAMKNAEVSLMFVF